MHTLTRRVRQRTDEIESGIAEHPRFSHATWAAVAIGVGGIGASLYGANVQRHDQRSADAANRKAIEEADLNSWRAYLMQRGLDPSGANQFGVIPQNAAPINSRLPLWATLTTPGNPQGPTGFTVRRRGA